MGADLYIETLDRKKQHTWLQTDVGSGYFRDAYNPSNLLWQFGLSYWEDVAKRFCEEKDDSCVMAPAQAKKLLAELRVRETAFERNLSALLKKRSPIWDYEQGSSREKEANHRPDEELTMNDRKEWVEYYRKHYERLKKFLRKAIKLNSNILCLL